MRGLPHVQLPGIADCIALTEACARVVEPRAKVVGLSFNTSKLDDETAEREMKDAAAKYGLPCVDPVRTGVGPLVDHLLSLD
jgi:uncharacterized NAD-dependent epimerase/dehydratase family protein